MIIEFQTFCKDYKERILNNYIVFEYVCPKCGAKARFHRHGTYFRWVTFLSLEDAILFESIEILRLQCQSCNSTHSVLPGEVIPFQLFSLPVVLFLCEQVLLKKDSLHHTQKKTRCSMQTIYQKLNLLVRNLALIELYLRQGSLYTDASFLSLPQALAFLLLPAMDFSSYFHCHGHPLFLNRRNTIDYPLYFSAAFSE